MTTSRGVIATGSILDRIVADKKEQLEAQKELAPVSALQARFADYDPQWPLSQSITTPRGAARATAALQIIAEIKKASPSKGMLAPDLDYAAVADAYTRGGAAGISVLTEVNYFLGHVDWLRNVRLQLQRDYPGARPSVLRKDFIVEPYEVVQSRAYGADNILLIVAMLDASLLRDLIAQALELGLEPLVEVHNETEAQTALDAGSQLFGINNRDLHTFKVDLAVTEHIRPLLPANALVIGESGVSSRADVERLRTAGVNAILVGEAFMTASNVAEKMSELMI